MANYELYLPPERKSYNAKTGHFLKGHTPWNKGKKWSDYLSKRVQRRMAKGWKNLDKYRPTFRPDTAGRCRKQVIAMHNGIVTAVSRTDMSAKRLATVKARRKNMDQWRKNTHLIEQYYDGNTEPMLAELQHIEAAVSRWFVQTYGLCEERADIVAAHGVNKYLDRLAEGFPSPYIMGCVIRYARGENSRISKLNSFMDNQEIIEI